LTNDDKYLISGSQDRTVKVWDLREKECKSTINHGVKGKAGKKVHKS
jgi:WD domain, G-beta repeat.